MLRGHYGPEHPPPRRGSIGRAAAEAPAAFRPLPVRLQTEGGGNKPKHGLALDRPRVGNDDAALPPPPPTRLSRSWLAGGQPSLCRPAAAAWPPSAECGRRGRWGLGMGDSLRAAAGGGWVEAAARTGGSRGGRPPCRWGISGGPGGAAPLAFGRRETPPREPPAAPARPSRPGPTRRTRKASDAGRAGPPGRDGAAGGRGQERGRCWPKREPPGRAGQQRARNRPSPAAKRAAAGRHRPPRKRARPRPAVE